MVLTKKKCTTFFKENIPKFSLVKENVAYKRPHFLNSKKKKEITITLNELDNSNFFPWANIVTITFIFFISFVS